VSEMTLYWVECRGEVRQVFEVEADTVEEAEQCWPYHGVPVGSVVTNRRPVDVWKVPE